MNLFGFNNSPEDRTRRRLAATTQALQAGRVGVEFFQQNTLDLTDRRKCAVMVLAQMKRLDELCGLLLGLAENGWPNRNMFTIGEEGDWIMCHACGMTSFNGNDAEHRYCGNCNKFHLEPKER